MLAEFPFATFRITDLLRCVAGARWRSTQSKSPGADKEANWLPAPNGPIDLVMRLYWLKTTPPSIPRARGHGGLPV